MNNCLKQQIKVRFANEEQSMSRIGLIGENSISYIQKLIDIWNNGDCAVIIDWRIPFNTACDVERS